MGHKFKPGNRMQAAGVTTREFTEALRYFIGKQCGPKGLLGRPKKCTMAQSMVIAMMNQAVKGDLSALAFLWEKIEGKLAAGLFDPSNPAPAEEMSLKELARVVGFLLISESKNVEEMPVIN